MMLFLPNMIRKFSLNHFGQPLFNDYDHRLAISLVRFGRQRRLVLLLHEQGEDDAWREKRLCQTSGRHPRNR